ncbi:MULTISPECIES: gas vesicle protein GvpG [Actinomadura]|uniref:Gas vesicle protein n=1 Tax=Actinomadura litoris TaxID=2678616 RepID=A0A7K1KXT7_9ACTN|nr:MULTISPECIES: gas vesicle protein GvpG [Actinomadura]MBT2209308.1 gas vesicle protein GvpG [Actinomadura sp. NEAU-AAG7]MUN36877.1 gas vesicle protein [Actinomadura litoris]
MGLFTGLLTLPLAPVRGVTWLAETLVTQAEERLYDPGRINAELQGLADRVADGELTEEEAAAAEDELFERLIEGRRRAASLGGAGG